MVDRATNHPPILNETIGPMPEPTITAFDPDPELTSTPPSTGLLILTAGDDLACVDDSCVVPVDPE